MFNLFSKPITVNFYTSSSGIYNFSQIKPAKTFLPEWWKKIPNYIDDPENLMKHTTMKGCVGLTSLFKLGFMLPLWSDLKVEVGAIGTDAFRYQYSDGLSSAVMHISSQRGDAYPANDYLHFKINSPWTAVCDEPVEFLFSSPVWNQEHPEKMIMFPGVVNFKYQNATNVNVLFKRQSEPVIYDLNFGMPLVHIIPITTRKVIIKCHLIDAQQHARLIDIARPTTFTRKYSNNKKIIEENKCPFHFKAEK